MECDRCGEPAVIFMNYSGVHLCADHFMESLEKRVYKEFRKQVDIGRGKSIAVAVSGGKDSLVALRLVKDILGARRDSKVMGITIDEGICGYRNSSIEIAKDQYDDIDVKYEIVSFEESFGLPLDEMVKRCDINACSICGVLRRWAMNLTAKELDTDLLATGLNLDDTAQSVLMNFCRGDMEKMSRMGPHRVVKEGLIPRIAPLRTIPENEVYLYAMLKKIPIHTEECPYAVSAIRGLYRDVIGTLEDSIPGTKYAILRSYDKLEEPLSDKYGGTVKLDQCDFCGEPTLGQVCKACEFLDRLGIGVRR